MIVGLQVKDIAQRVILYAYDLPEEKLIWVGNIKGEFIVKSAYYLVWWNHIVREKAHLGTLDHHHGGKCGT